MLLRNVVDQFLNQNGFTYTRTTKQTNFTSFCVWTQQVNHLDTCLQHLRTGSKILKRRGISVNRVRSFSLGLSYTVNGFSNHVKDRKSTRLNSSHVAISYAVFCLKKKR